MTLQDLINRFRARAVDVAVPPHWSDELLTIWANEAQMEACRRARIIEDKMTPDTCVIPVVAGTSIYQVDPRVIFIRRVKLASMPYKLPKVDSRDLDEYEASWESRDPDTPELWAPVGNYQIQLVPPPLINDTATLTVVREPLQPMSLFDNGLDTSSTANFGIEPAPTELGSFTLKPFNLAPQIAIADNANVTSIPAAVTGILSFGSPLKKLTLGIGWATWSPGYTGPVFYTSGNTIVMTMPHQTMAFTFYFENGSFNPNEVTITANDGTVIGPLIINSQGGANGVGIYTDNLAHPLTTITVTTTDTTGFAIANFSITQGALAVGPEIAPRYAEKLVEWMLYRAYSDRDVEYADPKGSLTALAAFTAEFGPPSTAKDEIWINRRHGFDDHEGLD